MKHLIKVADKFPFPGARFKDLGPQSGEEFKEYLIAKINQIYNGDFTHKKGSDIIIDLDGSAGYGSSFLEEGFGGLIREGVPAKIVKSITFVSLEEPELIDEIKDYLTEAEKAKSGKK